MRKLNYLIVLLFFPGVLFAQLQSITLKQCTDAAKENWPGFKKMALQNENRELADEVLNKNYLPKLTFSGSASYQSEVVEFPTVPNMDNFFPIFPNDNYRTDLQLTQILYDGGNTKKAKELQQASISLEERQIEIQNYNLMEQINQLYLTVLLLKKNQTVLLTALDEINENIKTLQSAFENGMILDSELNKIKVERISINKQILNTKTLEENTIKSLSVLTGLDISSKTVFEIPGQPLHKFSILPELKLFEAQKDLNLATLEIQNRNRFPKIALFANGGFGRPGYNFMNTDLHTYGIVGVNFSWDIFDWGVYSKQKEKTALKQKLIEADTEAFLKKNSLEIQKINNDIVNINRQISMDKEVVDIKAEIKNSSWSKFQNGTITSNEYLKDFTDLKRAQQTLEIDKIKLIQKRLELQHNTGVAY